MQLNVQSTLSEARAPTFLIVDDDEVDSLNCRRLLKKSFGDSAIDSVSTWSDAIEAMQSSSHDVYIVDQNLGIRTGLELVEQFRDEKQDCVFILLTGQEDHAIDVAATNAGASDYLIKADLSSARLERSIRYALSIHTQNRELARMASELEQTQIQLRKTLARAEESEKEYRHLAQHDVLTGLPNRMLFADRLNVAISDTTRNEKITALLQCDLDRFKQINDTFGHQTGDYLLQEVSRRLSDCVRGTDTVARLGGDEFAVLLTHIHDRRDAAIVADKMVRTISEQYEVKGQTFNSGLSIGVAILDGSTNDSEEILHQADLALYRAKETGRGQYQFFDKGLNEAAKRVTLLTRELTTVIERGELYLHYQPKFDLRTNRLCGVEALARWLHPELGQIPPSEFIPIAEKSGQIVQISEWILNEAVKTSKRLTLALGADLPVSVNLSAVQLRQEGLRDLIEKVLREHGVDFEQLELEITETSAVENLASASSQLDAVRNLGSKVSIDDFGTGYSSLAVATHLPADKIKIDRHFVSGMLDVNSDAAAVHATIGLAHSLGMSVVAEGVENYEQLENLKAFGCDSAQGYLIGRPMAADDIANLFENWWERWIEIIDTSISEIDTNAPLKEALS